MKSAYSRTYGPLVFNLQTTALIDVDKILLVVFIEDKGASPQ